MRRVLSAAQMRALDAAASELHGVPSTVLMENAGTALAQEALKLVSPTGRVLVLCGSGNNSGDGLVAARKLAGSGKQVLVELLVEPEKLTGDPARNYQALVEAGVRPSPISIEQPVGAGDVVIDAIFGTGLSRTPEGDFAKAIERINAWRAAGAKVIAADLPSGLATDTGQPFNPCVSADVTVAFGELKLCHALGPGASLCGQTRVVDIGIPGSASSVLQPPLAYLLDEQSVRARLPSRSANTHKGSFGHVLVVAGSAGKSGAAVLSALGALRGGAGLVTVAARPAVLAGVLAHAPEIMGAELPANGPLGLGDLNTLLELADGKQSIVIGPGIPRGEDTPRLLSALLEELELPCVLDADGLNAAAASKDLLRNAKAPLLLTPHPGEMARLLELSTAEVQADRLGAVRALAITNQALAVLKGARTLICTEDGTTFVNPTGNPGMATAGTGDVLAGLCGALLAQGLSVEDAAVIGVFAHGLAGDLAAERSGQLGLIASDLLEGLKQVWIRWQR